MEEVDANSGMNSNAKPLFPCPNNTNYILQASKDSRNDNNNDNNSSTKMKGVVPQQNGHWGAQIYANHQRIWLGTFKSEKEAAMAYDSAAIKLRSSDTYRNFPWTNNNIKEPDFQNQYSTDDVLNMIRDGSYCSKFEEFLRTQSQSEEIGLNNMKQRMNRNGQCSCCQLFQKELTPSDVGKLNRLVIPKKYALKYFPYIRESVEENGDGGCGRSRSNDTELVFFDKLMKLWKFRYCYWRSSQSFVFTRGWNRFVKEKKLKANDIIIFYTCEDGQSVEKGQAFWLIDVIYNNNRNQSKSCLAEGSVKGENLGELELNLGNVSSCKENEEEKQCEEEKVFDGLNPIENVGEKGFKLFGVHISDR